jgi:hypothetical protein
MHAGMHSNNKAVISERSSLEFTVPVSEFVLKRGSVRSGVYCASFSLGSVYKLAVLSYLTVTADKSALLSILEAEY